MNKVIATGILWERQTTIEVFKKDGEIKILVNGFEGSQRPLIESYFFSKLKHPPVMGGTFYPKSDTLLGAYSVLENDFFDQLGNLEVKGKLGKMPSKEGVIY